jgi:hypothetical protein
MGDSVTSLVVRGKNVEAILACLSLQRATGKRGYRESKIIGAQLPSGDYLISTNFDTPYAQDETLSRLSINAGVITCKVEDHCMFSSASAWNNGRRIWHVEHDSELGITHLRTEGSLPPQFAEISSRLIAKQQEPQGDENLCDYIFDIPVELARVITGFRYDQDVPGLGDDAYEGLVSTQVRFPFRFPKFWSK